jgi:hypothetical protein
VQVLTLLNLNSWFLRINIVRVIWIVAVFYGSDYFDLGLNQTIFIYSFVLAAHHALVLVQILFILRKRRSQET